MLLVGYYCIYLLMFGQVIMNFLSYKRMTKKYEFDILTKTYLIFASFSLNLICPLVLNNQNQFFSRFVVCMLIGYFSVPILYYMKSFFKKIVQYPIWRDYKYGFFIFIFSYFLFHLKIPNHIDYWVSVWYGADYSLGFGSRFFIGWLLHLFCGEYVDAKVAYAFCYFSLLSLLLLVSFLLNQLIIHTKQNLRPALLFLICLFVFSPVFISGVAESSFFGRLEFYTYILSLVSVIGFHFFKKIYIKYGVATVLSCVSMAIYQGYIFLVYPIVLMLFLYDILKDKNINLKKISFASISVFFTGVTFLIFQFFSTIHSKTTSEFVAQIQKLSNVEVTPLAVEYEFFKPLSDIYADMMAVRLVWFYQNEQLLAALICFLPVIYFFILLYICAFKYEKNRPFYKNIYVYFLMVNFLILPQFILNVDWGRWFFMLFNLLFFGVFYLVYQRNFGMLYGLKILNGWLKKYWIIAFVILVYLFSLSDLSTDYYFFEDGFELLKFIFKHTRGDGRFFFEYQ